MKRLQLQRVAPMLLAVLLALAWTVPALANAGPPTRYTRGEVDFLVPEENKAVDILGEELSYELIAQGKESYANVAARYLLQNNTPQERQVTMAFVASQAAQAPEITLNGSRLAVLSHESVTLGRRFWPDEMGYYGPGRSAEGFGREDPTFEEVLYFVSTGLQPELEAGQESWEVYVSAFAFALPPNGQGELAVSYREQASVVSSRSGGYSYTDSYQFYYFFEPARYWNSFADLTITIQAPGRQYKVDSTLGEFSRSGTTYTRHYDTLPPKNMVITLTPVKIPKWPFVLGGIAVLVALFLLRRKKEQSAVEKRNGSH